MFSKLRNSKTVEDGIMMFPVLFAIAVIPLFVRFAIFNPTLSEYSWFSTSTQEGDIFMNSKQGAMFFLDALLILGILQLALKKELPKLKVFLLLAVYALMILLSTFVSVSSYHSWNGFDGMMESTAVLLGYCGICYYTYGVIKSEKHLKIVMFALFISVSILCILGLTQMFGCDIFVSDIGKFFLFPAEYESYKDSMVQKMAGLVSSTLFNPNYVGIYTCMIIPIFLTLGFTAKKKIHLLLYTILLALTTCALIGSGSKTAILTLAPCLVFLIFYFGRQIGKKIIPVFAAIIIFVLALTLYQGDNSLIATVISRISMGYTPDKTFALEDITLNDENYILKYKDKELTISYEINVDDYALIIKENNTTIPVSYNEEAQGYLLEDSFYKELSFQALTANNKQIGYVVHCEGDKFNICYSNTDKTYYYLNNYGKYTKLYKAEIFDFPLFHLMGGFSGRDYIWQRSVPILKQTIFLGSGPDTYAFMFPQYDYIAAAQNGFDRTLVTKPHNTYLQIGIQTGVISLVAYLAFYILYFVDCVKLYLNRKLNTFPERCGAGIFIGSFCYMFAGLLHDSTIGVSIVFWVLIALGYVCNRMVKEAEHLPEDSIVWKKKFSTGYVLISLLVVCTVSVAGYCITDAFIEKPVDGRTIFKTDAIHYNGISDNSEQTIPFQASMTTEWNFANGTSASENAFVANKEENARPISFDVVLDSGETIYTSSVIPIGGRIDNIVLEKELSAGTYHATVTYHLLDKNNSEVATAQITIVINILN
ncbi:MAG: O-antigen ligase family protein [Agathobacter sp.]|nr:O-antigen ligase family protein [Agathobacter sp.]